MVPLESLLEKVLVLREPIPLWAWTRWVMEGGARPAMAGKDMVEEAAEKAGEGSAAMLVGSILEELGGWASVPMVMDVVERRLCEHGKSD